LTLFFIDRLFESDKLHNNLIQHSDLPGCDDKVLTEVTRKHLPRAPQ